MSREYPQAPVAAVGVVVTREDGRILLTRRANPPEPGSWSLPGGKLELGETVAEAARREVLEECGVRCEPLDTYYVFDRLLRDPDGRVRYHYVIIDLLARWVNGEAKAGSDVSAVGWFTPGELAALDLSVGVEETMRALLAPEAAEREGETGREQP